METLVPHRTNIPSHAIVERSADSDMDDTEVLAPIVDDQPTIQPVLPAWERVGDYKARRDADTFTGPMWPGQSMANRVLLSAPFNRGVTTHQAPDAVALYHDYVHETWPDDSAFTVAHQEQLTEQLSHPHTKTRRQMREQERLEEQRKKLEQPMIRRVGGTCLNWALSKIAK